MIDVVAGIILNSSNQVLIAKRSLHKHLGGKWEFPGGKVEKNETLESALERELKEEFDILTITKDKFITVQKRTGNINIKLFSFFSEITQGTPKLIEHEKFEWTNIDTLLSFDLASADIDIATALIKKLGK